MFSVQPLIVATLLTQLALVVGSCAKGDLPEGHLTEKDHPDLFKATVIHAKVVNRPLGILPKYGWISHSGVVVTLNFDNKKVLIHKLGCGTVVQDTKTMDSENWEQISEQNCHKGKTLAALVEDGGTGYNVAIDNCHQTKNMVMNSVKRTMEQKSNRLIKRFHV